MNNEDEVVYSVTTHISREQLLGFIKILNEYEIDEDEGEELFTVEEVLSKPDLLKYICTEAVNDGVALYDPIEFWNNDGWCDVKDFR